MEGAESSRESYNKVIHEQATLQPQYSKLNQEGEENTLALSPITEDMEEILQSEEYKIL